MKINFTKMQSLGNDFVVIDAVRQKISPTPELIRKIADRHYGIGCDQVLLAAKSNVANVDFVYRIFNQDGSEVGQCGNGARCLAKFLTAEKLTKKKRICVATLSGKLELILSDDGDVKVNLGVPKIEQLNKKLNKWALNIIFLGNPHAVVAVSNFDHVEVKKAGAKIAQNKIFPEGSNVEFMQIVNRNNINLRIIERGVGETLACGSGAAAAMVVGKALDFLDSEVAVKMPGGTLQVTWSGSLNDGVWLKGSAETVFCGQFLF